MIQAWRLFVVSILVAGAGALVGCSADETSTPGTAPVLSTTTTAGSTTSAPPPSTDAPGATSTTAVPETTTSLVPLADLDLRLVEVASGFDSPVLLTVHPGGGEPVIVEQPGRILRIDSKAVVLDIRSDVSFGGERGLLGLAFHPEFATNRLAYVNYIDGGGDTRIDEFEVLDDGTFDVESRNLILRIGQPAGNHNGGMIAFGPDGYLWIGMGDGGGADDRFGNGQRAGTTLGAMLRIAVGVEGVATYAVPLDNPFADGQDGAPEVFWTGLRNPWRFSFDGSDVWIADVGQNSIEEVNVSSAAVRALNFGWPVLEGTSCFQASTCDREPYVAPVTEFGHDRGCSVTGGYVYRGAAIPELNGEYFFSDYCGGFLASYSVENGNIDWSDRVGLVPNVSSFGVGADGELYVISHAGPVYRLEVVR